LTVNRGRSLIGIGHPHSQTANERPGFSLPLDPGPAFCKLPLVSSAPTLGKEMLNEPMIVGETLRDFEFPQREAAFFYGLFLRGHSPDELRRDIEVPAHVLAKWHREAEREPSLREPFDRMVEYRRHVLAIFDALINFERHPVRIQ
jgi:hypothetical protein